MFEPSKKPSGEPEETGAELSGTETPEQGASIEGDFRNVKNRDLKATDRIHAISEEQLGNIGEGKPFVPSDSDADEPGPPTNAPTTGEHNQDASREREVNASPEAQPPLQASKQGAEVPSPSLSPSQEASTSSVPEYAPLYNGETSSKEMKEEALEAPEEITPAEQSSNNAEANQQKKPYPYPIFRTYQDDIARATGSGEVEAHPLPESGEDETFEEEPDQEEYEEEENLSEDDEEETSVPEEEEESIEVENDSFQEVASGGLGYGGLPEPEEEYDEVIEKESGPEQRPEPKVEPKSKAIHVSPIFSHKREAKPEKKKREGNKDTFLLFGSFVFILVAIAVLFYVLVFDHTEEGPALGTQQTFIQTEKKQVVVLKNGTAPKDLERSLSGLVEQRVPDDTFTQAYIEKEVPVKTKDGTVLKRRFATPQEFFDTLKSTMPEILQRTLTAHFMVGLYGHGGKNSPFLLLSVKNYEMAFSGMHSWEQGLSMEYASWFGLSMIHTTPTTPPTVETTGSSSVVATNTTSTIATSSQTDKVGTTTSATSTSVQPSLSPGDFLLQEQFENKEDATFQNIVIQNKSARVLEKKDGSIIFLYSFYGPHAIIITDNLETFEAVLKRLNNTVG